MRSIAVFLLCLCGMVYAEPRTLPPVININNSTASNGSTYHRSMLKMLEQIESLQTKTQQLHGMLEQQSHEIDRLKRREKNIYADISQRLQQLESIVKIPVTPNQTQQVKKVKPKPRSEEKAAFDKAFASVKNNHHQLAISQFEQFLQDYPKSNYADNAYFWLGSVYQLINDIVAAKKNFKAVYTQFPKSEKANMALRKLADIDKNKLIK